MNKIILKFLQEWCNVPNVKRNAVWCMLICLTLKPSFWRSTVDNSKPKSTSSSLRKNILKTTTLTTLLHANTNSQISLPSKLECLTGIPFSPGNLTKKTLVSKQNSKPRLLGLKNGNATVLFTASFAIGYKQKICVTLGMTLTLGVRCHWTICSEIVVSVCNCYWLQSNSSKYVSFFVKR